jgi:hypothetical protein
MLAPAIVFSGCLQNQIQPDSVALEKPPIRFLAFHRSRAMALGNLSELAHYI